MDMRNLLAVLDAGVVAYTRDHPIEGAPPEPLYHVLAAMRDQAAREITRDEKAAADHGMRERAEDLPRGTVVLIKRAAPRRDVVLIKNDPSSSSQWRGTDGGYWHNVLVDEEAETPGSRVLMIGEGQS